MTQQQIPQPRLPDPFRQPPKRSRLWLWILLAVVTAGVLGAGAWGLGVPSVSTTHTVLYEVTADTASGSGRSGMLTLQTENGGTSQAVVDLPFNGPSTSFHPGDFLYLSVQNQQGIGSVTCRITVDGVVVSENTSSGGYTIATCQGSVPR
jgi:hypothetical protein